jgi:hypothetical protein
MKHDYLAGVAECRPRFHRRNAPDSVPNDPRKYSIRFLRISASIWRGDFCLYVGCSEFCRIDYRDRIGFNAFARPQSGGNRIGWNWIVLIAMIADGERNQANSAE